VDATTRLTDLVGRPVTTTDGQRLGRVADLAVDHAEILFLTQALNAVLLPPLLILMARMARDPELMGRQRSGRLAAVAYGVTIAVVVACVGALAVLSFS
jgi:Mn2+/Fe2+ NRAMP family transporter